MNLALFDLDHTLIPFDSGMAWTRFLAERGHLPPDAPAHYLAHCQQLVAGALGIRELHRATVGAIAWAPHSTVQQWAQAFGAAMREHIPADMQALVRRHQQASDCCVLATATTRFIAEPLAHLFGITHVLATESARHPHEHTLTGEIVGVPCHGEGKLTHLQRWLQAQPQGPWQLSSFKRSWFYSDSFSDLPLLSAVSDPVAVRPDARLRAHAQQQGWRTI